MFVILPAYSIEIDILVHFTLQIKNDIKKNIRLLAPTIWITHEKMSMQKNNVIMKSRARSYFVVSFVLRPRY